jgi:MoaA/NifB/PqqE/SkfB family radical SAM enzyme
MFPSDEDKEIGSDVYRKLPRMGTINVTGGEPFLRKDLIEVISVLKAKTSRLVISTNGYFTQRIVDLCKQYPDIGIRVSLEGLEAANDELRGIEGGFEHGFNTLKELEKNGIKDIGFGITVSDRNAMDMLDLYELSAEMNFEFATAAIHNSFYFHKYDNRFENPEVAIEQFKVLAEKLLSSWRPKKWFRAYFNYGLMNYINGGARLLPCEMAYDSFFLDPYGEILPCNVMEGRMGNLKDSSFEEIWNSDKAEEIRRKVRNCNKNCWMIGSVSQQMKKRFYKPAWWVIKHKFLGRPVTLPE